ncbi:hypothetical protein DPQ25_00675 [Hydrogeniiclostridium mannosilyticum]|uniref:Dynamin N-terminal domain-containing protein n=1 Tax=Hydrogeniiclostridium mannosilyticum TaxID=2764322 RepID=A0A328UDW7_9FIRM|nr:dynamin family protein [Hydrogeniiclostridium mannosilyticum]RAQ30057.1 hypothetical protein DPQ25_00675 [Hydrogeniiclostridium mannosilyticum]
MFLKNKNFFDDPAPLKERTEKTDVQEENASSGKEQKDWEDVNLSFYDEAFMARLQKLEGYCREAGRKDLLEQLASIRAYLASEKFSVAVVGEFNRGKSTLVNRLIGRDIIPTSDIPTTSLPIYVSGGEQESITLKTVNGQKRYPVAEKSWEAIEEEKKKLRETKGAILLKRNCSLLMENDLELVDTPGVNSQIRGDLSMAEQALSGCDCAILPMAAIAAFSESEKLFLQERILMKKVPRIMVVLTKLDLVEEKQRLSVVESVQRKLEAMEAEIPLYLSAENMAEGWEERSGTEAIRKQILAWLHESSHIQLKKERASQEIKAVSADLATVYQCQLDIIAEKEEKRKETAEQSKQKLLRSAQIQWDALETDMLNRCNQNFEWIRSMTEERQQDVIEKLTLELTHVANPKDWWEKDYPYRMKMEMISLGNILENNLQGFYTRDVNWLNHLLEEKYGSAIPPQNQRIAEKGVFRAPMVQQAVELEDMKRSRLISRVGTGVATVGGYLVGGLIGLSPIGMAVGIGGGIISEVFMNKRVESQKRELTRIIREELPGVFSGSIETVERNIREVYISTIRTMKRTCSDWVKVKCDAIDAAQKQADDPKREEAIRQKLAELRGIGI